MVGLDAPAGDGQRSLDLLAGMDRGARAGQPAKPAVAKLGSAPEGRRGLPADP